MKNTFLLLCLVALAFSCSDDNDHVKEEENRPAVGETRAMTIAGAKSLLALGSPGSPYGRTGDARPAYTPNLYKITEGGAMEVVKFLDAQGNAIDTDKAGTYALVRWITPIGEDYLVLTGDFVFPDSVSTKQYRTMLVRKADGAIFNFTVSGLIPEASRLGEAIVKADDQGNLYYLASNGGGAVTVKKITLDDPEQPAVSDYTPAGQQAYYFEIDARGNCLYKYGASAGVTENTSADLRIRKADGSVFKIEVAGRNNGEAWLGNNGSFYFISYTRDAGYQAAIHKIDIVGSDVSVSTVWSTEDAHLGEVVGNTVRTYNRGAYMIRKEKSVVFVDTHARGFHWEFLEEENMVRTVKLPAVGSETLLAYSAKYYYLVTSDNLYKVNLATHAYEALLSPNTYEIYSLSVDPEDVVQFSGGRISDRKMVVGEITATGALKILSEELALPAVVMQRLN